MHTPVHAAFARAATSREREAIGDKGNLAILLLNSSAAGRSETLPSIVAYKESGSIPKSQNYRSSKLKKFSLSKSSAIVDPSGKCPEFTPMETTPSLTIDEAPETENHSVLDDN
jgi:hypothetical protein